MSDKRLKSIEVYFNIPVKRANNFTFDSDIIVTYYRGSSSIQGNWLDHSHLCTKYRLKLIRTRKYGIFHCQFWILLTLLNLFLLFWYFVNNAFIFSLVLVIVNCPSQRRRDGIDGIADEFGSYLYFHSVLINIIPLNTSIPSSMIKYNL